MGVAEGVTVVAVLGVGTLGDLVVADDVTLGNAERVHLRLGEPQIRELAVVRHVAQELGGVRPGLRGEPGQPLGDGVHHVAAHRPGVGGEQMGVVTGEEGGAALREVRGVLLEGQPLGVLRDGVVFGRCDGPRRVQGLQTRDVERAAVRGARADGQEVDEADGQRELHAGGQLGHRQVPVLPGDIRRVERGRGTVDADVLLGQLDAVAVTLDPHTDAGGDLAVVRVGLQGGLRGEHQLLHAGPGRHRVVQPQRSGLVGSRRDDARVSGQGGGLAGGVVAEPPDVQAGHRVDDLVDAADGDRRGAGGARDRRGHLGEPALVGLGGEQAVGVDAAEARRVHLPGRRLGGDPHLVAVLAGGRQGELLGGAVVEVGLVGRDREGLQLADDLQLLGGGGRAVGGDDPARAGAARGQHAVVVRGEVGGFDADPHGPGRRVGEPVDGVHPVSYTHGVEEDAVGDRAFGVAGQVGGRVDDLGPVGPGGTADHGGGATAVEQHRGPGAVGDHVTGDLVPRHPEGRGSAAMAVDGDDDGVLAVLGDADGRLRVGAARRGAGRVPVDLAVLDQGVDTADQLGDIVVGREVGGDAHLVTGVQAVGEPLPAVAGAEQAEPAGGQPRHGGHPGLHTVDDEAAVRGPPEHQRGRLGQVRGLAEIGGDLGDAAGRHVVHRVHRGERAGRGAGGDRSGERLRAHHHGAVGLDAQLGGETRLGTLQHAPVGDDAAERASTGVDLEVVAVDAGHRAGATGHRGRRLVRRVGEGVAGLHHPDPEIRIGQVGREHLHVLATADGVVGLAVVPQTTGDGLVRRTGVVHHHGPVLRCVRQPVRLRRVPGRGRVVGGTEGGSRPAHGAGERQRQRRRHHGTAWAGRQGSLVTKCHHAFPRGLRRWSSTPTTTAHRLGGAQVSGPGGEDDHQERVHGPSVTRRSPSTYVGAVDPCGMSVQTVVLSVFGRDGCCRRAHSALSAAVPVCAAAVQLGPRPAGRAAPTHRPGQRNRHAVPTRRRPSQMHDAVRTARIACEACVLREAVRRAHPPVIGCSAAARAGGNARFGAPIGSLPC